MILYGYKAINIGKILLLLFMFMATASAANEMTIEITKAGSSFSGSEGKNLLDLWSQEQLQGSAADKKISRSFDLKPPERTEPINKNFPLKKEWRYSIRGVEPFNNDKIIALTFDLCEKANEVTGYDAEIVNTLRLEKVEATFFAGGKWMRSHKQKAMQLMADPLFELGNHGWTHGNLAVLKGKKLEEQILWTQAQYELLREELSKKALTTGVDSGEINKIPQSLTLFRPPYGRCSTEALDALASYGLASIQWNIVSGDPARGQTPQKIVATVLRQAKPGAIVIMHGNGRGYGTARALPAIISDLKAKGYRFVKVSELLNLGRILSSPECYEIKPGDNQKYDFIFGTGTGE